MMEHDATHGTLPPPLRSICAALIFAVSGEEEEEEVSLLVRQWLKVRLLAEIRRMQGARTLGAANRCRV